MLFVGLCAFTSMTTERGPEQTHAVVDSYLTEATRVVVAHDGSVDKYIGDALMAVFNVPIRRPDHAVRAVAAAQDILALMPRLSERHGRELQARPGEVVMDVDVYRQVAADYPGAVPETMELKGFPAPALGHRVAAAGADPDARQRAGSLGHSLAYKSFRSGQLRDQPVHGLERPAHAASIGIARRGVRPDCQGEESRAWGSDPECRLYRGVAAGIFGPPLHHEPHPFLALRH